MALKVSGMLAPVVPLKSKVGLATALAPSAPLSVVTWAASWLATKMSAATTPVIKSTPVTTINKAKNVIFLFMEGGPSHIDLFDPKPLLAELAPEAAVPVVHVALLGVRVRRQHVHR